MSEDIKSRLNQACEVCVKAYEAWNADEKSAENREQLQESIHELRKVASRLEIELAISERDQNVQKPIPIPPHRDAKGRAHNGDGNDHQARGRSKQGRRKTGGGPKKSSKGGNA